MYIYLHTHREGVYVCVHIGVGFSVACSELRAIPGPRIAEQQQCSPAFLCPFVWFIKKHKMDNIMPRNNTPVISIIVCSQDKHLQPRLNSNIEMTIGVDFELICIYNENNQYSIFEAYNMGVERAKGKILCFQHNDIEYLSKNWGVHVEWLLSSPYVDACAVAGANYMRKSPSYYPIGKGYNVINLIQKTYKGDIEWHEFDKPTPMIVFDGLWFCIKKECFSKIHFDSNLYKGFHFYDIDISTQLITNGYKIVGIPNVKIKHNSGGVTNSIWLKNSFLYAKKWKDVLPLSCNEIDTKSAIVLEYRALYSAFRGIIIKRQFHLLGTWFHFAMDICNAGPLCSLIIIFLSHKKYYQ